MPAARAGTPDILDGRESVHTTFSFQYARQSAGIAEFAPEIFDLFEMRHADRNAVSLSSCRWPVNGALALPDRHKIEYLPFSSR
ncbi:hypothetical protein RBSWK_02983 [Rhodopirellula baltica SWK14]|uniref:Uncharacterized protein n=1 Tax=Rhodopirellula baltica SWK14 TaxID=993516 RepID=L7CHN2_RHOBT|nr:hypothetical protein RBSWK_02983 [Rhodopirellula baltica SWK14]